MAFLNARSLLLPASLLSTLVAAGPVPTEPIPVEAPDAVRPQDALVTPSVVQYDPTKTYHGNLRRDIISDIKSLGNAATSDIDSIISGLGSAVRIDAFIVQHELSTDADTGPILHCKRSGTILSKFSHWKQRCELPWTER